MTCASKEHPIIPGKLKSLEGAIRTSLGSLLDGRPVALLDFPDHMNCGDSAIWLGEMSYLSRYHGIRPKYVSRMRDFSPVDLRARVPDGPILIHGGGNFGDIWVWHQEFRERIIAEFPDRQIIQLPQTIHFSSEKRRDDAARIIDRHPNFTLLVRDAASFEIANTHFNCQVMMCPDMAFAIGPLARRAEITMPILAMLRIDRESSGWDSGSTLGIPKEDWMAEDLNPVRIAKLKGVISSILIAAPSELRLSKFHAAAQQRFDRGVRQISKASTIITDRLHVHIVSMLIGIPHAVLDNSYGKVSSFMSAFSGGTDLSCLCTDFEEAVRWVRTKA